MKKLQQLQWREEGFFLIEVLVVTALLGVVLSGIFGFYLFGVRGWREGTNQIDLQQNARIGMERMVQELQWVRALVNMDELGGSEGAPRVAFKLPGDDLVYVFRRYGNELVMETYTEPYGGQQTGWESHVKVASHITALKVRWDGVNGLAIRLTAAAGEREVTLQSAVFPRNMS